MTGSNLPIHQFSSQKKRDLPFEILQIETLPEIARTPLPHRHTFYQVFWIVSGSGHHSIDFDPCPIVPRTLYFISTGQVHFWQIEQPLSGYVILFTEEFLPGSAYEPVTPRTFSYFHRPEYSPMLTLPAEHARPFDELCQHMLQEFQGRAFGRLSVLQAQLRILLVLAERHYLDHNGLGSPSVADLLVKNYLGLIDLHFRELHHVSDYAARLGVTPGHLTDMTRETTGLSAGKFIHRRIILEAQRLLAWSEDNVSEIALALNFDDPAYFSRFFRRECGMTPSRFRDDIRKKYHDIRTFSL
jgi:AraC-like DNA-binding protein